MLTWGVCAGGVCGARGCARVFTARRGWRLTPRRRHSVSGRAEQTMASQGVQNALFGFSVLGTAAWYAVLTADTVSANSSL